jgi:hypothetical protein
MNGFNLAQFKKVKEDKQTVTMGHPDGHTIMISKAALPTLQRKQLERMPVHMANAGIVDSSGDAPPEHVLDSRDPNDTPPPPVDAPAVNPNTPASGGSDSAAAGASLGIPGATADTAATPDTNLLASNDNAQAEAMAANATAPGAAPAATAPANSGAAQVDKDGNPIDLNASYVQGQQAISEHQDVASQLAANDADIQARDIAARQDLQTQATANLAALQKHKDDFTNYIQAHPIDPNHYLENMGTGKKISTAIGLMLGGLSGGLTGTGINPAQQWLNAQIERDIEGQKSRMDQQKTILGANQELYGDQNIALNMARTNMNDLYDRQIQQEATKLGTPAAKAAADAAHSQFAMANYQNLQQASIRQTAMQAIKNGGAGIDPVTLGHAGLMDPGEATKEQASLDKQKQSIATAKNIYAQLSKLQVPGNALNFQANRQVNALHAQLLPLIQSEDPSARLTEEALKNELEPFTSGKLDNTAVATGKLQGVLNLIKQRHAGETPNFSRLAPLALPNYNVLTQAQKAVQWAHMNPKDPRAAQLLQKYGGAPQTQMAR